MSTESRRMAGILLVVFPTVVFGGFSLLNLLLHDPGYTANPLRQDLWRAGHAHAGVLLILSLVALRYVDDANLSERSNRRLDRPSLRRQFCFRLHFFFPYCRQMQLRPTHLSISLTQVRSFSRSHYWFLESDCSGKIAYEQRCDLTLWRERAT